MMDKSTTHVLVASGDSDAAQRIISQLQHEGMSVAAGTATTSQKLASLLRQAQWDALICVDDCAIPQATVLDLASQCSPSVPVILLTSIDKNTDLLPTLDRRISDAVPDGQPRRLFLSLQREALNIRLQRQLAQVAETAIAYDESERTLAAPRATPIAYIHGGIHLHCNHSYARLFGFGSITEVVSTPVLDLILEQDHGLVKPHLAGTPATETSVAIRALSDNARALDVLLTFRPASFQHRPCLQVVACPLNTTEMPASTVDTLATEVPHGLVTSTQFFAEIERIISTASETGTSSAVLVIGHYTTVPVPAHERQAKVGLHDILARAIGFLTDYLRKPFTVTYLDSDVYGLIINHAGSDELTALNALIRSYCAKPDSRDAPQVPGPHFRTGHVVMDGRHMQVEYALLQACGNLAAAQQAGVRQQLLKWRRDSVDDIAILEQLNLALTRQRFKLLYQPIVPLKRAGQTIYEVFARLLDSHGQEILPAAFISVANQHGFGEQVDRCIASLALQTLASVAERHLLLLHVSTNTLMSQTFLPWLGEQLNTRKISAAACAITISEIDISNNEVQAFAFCAAVRAAGLKLVISHFGCATDACAPLATLLPDMIKLDSFVLKDLGRCGTHKATLQTLVANLHQRGIVVIAPQVEMLSQLPSIWGTGIDYVQGYGLQAPAQEINFHFLRAEEITLSAGRL